MPDDMVFLGYDIRKVRQTRYCDVFGREKLLSVDQMVCPRPATLKPFDWARVHNGFQTPYGLCTTLKSALDLWNNFEKSARQLYEIIGIGLLRDSFQVCVNKKLFEPADEVPDHQDDRGEFSGFEIATLEYEWISFFTNCGSEKEIEKIIPKSGMNESYLLDSFRVAENVLRLSEKIIPEHSPFGIWGLWSIADIGNQP